MDNDKITEVVLEECFNIEEVLNKDLLKKFVELHNINNENNMLKLKQEVLSKSSIFFTKKKYGMYIINREKVPVSEYEIKGMIMRRSNFPSASKEKINELLDLILKSDYLDLNKINKFIEKTRYEFLDLCKQHSKKIAGAVSFNKNNDDYKNRLPYQVEAMELWNEIEYPYFVRGSKGYLFKILGIDVHNAPKRILDNISLINKRNKQIVIPFEEEKLPDYYILDTDSQMKFCWDDRVKEIMDVFKTDNKNIEDEELLNYFFG